MTDVNVLSVFLDCYRKQVAHQRPLDGNEIVQCRRMRTTRACVYVVSKSEPATSRQNGARYPCEQQKQWILCPTLRWICSNDPVRRTACKHGRHRLQVNVVGSNRKYSTTHSNYSGRHSCRSSNSARVTRPRWEVYAQVLLGEECSPYPTVG